MELLSQLSEWFTAGFFGALVLVVAGLGVALFGLADEYGGAKSFTLSVLGFAFLVGLFFIFLGVGVYIAAAINAPGILGWIAGSFAFVAAANLYDRARKRRPKKEE